MNALLGQRHLSGILKKKKEQKIGLELREKDSGTSVS